MAFVFYMACFLFVCLFVCVCVFERPTKCKMSWVSLNLISQALVELGMHKYTVYTGIY